MTEPYFSIITCTKNSEKYLKRNVSSVENQTYKSYEHIFVDGYSTDNTIKIIKEYKNNRENISLIRQKPKGISVAMNEGITKAKGKYTLFLNSDDYLYSKSVLKDTYELIQKMDEPEMVYGMINIVSHEEKKHGLAPKFFLFKKTYNYLLKIINYIPHQAVFLRSDIFDRYGKFDTSLKYCMDYEYWLRITPHINWKYIPLIVSNYRIHSKSATGNPRSVKEIKMENWKIKEKYLDKTELFFCRQIEKLI